MARITNLHINEAPNNSRKVYPVWNFDEDVSTVDHYDIDWAYNDGRTRYNRDSNGNIISVEKIWIHGSDGHAYADPNAYDPSVEYEPPADALQIRCTVWAVAKTYKVNGEDYPYWATTYERLVRDSPSYIYPDAPANAPTIELSKVGGSQSYNFLKAKIDLNEYSSGNTSGTPPTRQIQLVAFELWNGNIKVKREELEFKNSDHVFVVETGFNIISGGNYRVRCQVGRWVPGTTTFVKAEAWSPWSPWSNALEPPPSAPSGFKILRAASSSSVYLEWDPVNQADSYDIEYTTNPDYFGGSNATTTQTGIETTKYTLTGLESGDEYYFRLRAVNHSGGSDWSPYKSVIIGKKPAAPTTWSSTSTAIVGEPLNLYWVHNSADGSWMKYAQVEIYYDDQKVIETVENTQQEDEDGDNVEKSHHFSVDTSKWPEGTTIKWRVRTSGITNEYGDWSIQREVKVYAQPTLELHLTDSSGGSFAVLKQFPIHVEAFAGPKTQEPMGYHISITALGSYETVDDLGRPMEVRAGEVIMSKHVTTKDTLDMTISASDVNLDGGQSYTLKVVVSMNSGLTGEASSDFEVNWTDEMLNPSASIAIDYITYTARVIPRCLGLNHKPVPGVDLAVYRREFDGAFTEIMSGIDSETHTLVVDPHPALDYARYRIIARTRSTGAISFYDVPAYPIKGSEVVLQWDEEWYAYDTNIAAELEPPSWSGSMIKLRGNIDVSDNVTPQATLVNYIGRTYPVSYYGTAIDSSATWNMDIPKSDKETLYALRRLQNWKGDVYVREPSGSGYWANVAVSFSQTHKEVVIPISLNITRVEGGA